MFTLPNKDLTQTLSLSHIIFSGFVNYGDF
jgi:hypothetical protein